MAVELGWTVEQVEDFGTEFFDRAFEMRGAALSRQSMRLASGELDIE